MKYLVQDSVVRAIIYNYSKSFVIPEIFCTGSAGT
jgi:hypothetical protein